MKLFLENNISQIPMRVKAEMLEDFQRLASLPQGSSETSARAALHVVFAHAASFGTAALPLKSVGFWIRKSVEGGLPIACLMKKLLETALKESSPPIKQEGPNGYNKTLRLTIRTLARSEFPPLSGIGPRPTFAVLLNAVQSIGDQSLVAHYAIIYQLTKILPRRYVNVQSSKTGETALSLACRLGDYEAAKNLLNLGAEPCICTADGCSALHWLFVFDKIYIRKMAERLRYFGATNKVADRPQLLDAQLPIDLSGTPLEFAVAAASISAVETLIPYSQTNVDPASRRGAFRQATSLYLYEILAKLEKSYGSLASSFIDLGDLAKSSLVIKKLIHGHDLSVARDRTLKQLLSCFRDQSNAVDKIVHVSQTQIISGLRSAIQARDILLAQNLIKSVLGITIKNDLVVGSKTITTPEAGRCFTEKCKPMNVFFRSQRATISDISFIQTGETASQDEQKKTTSLGSAVSLSCAEVACSSIYDSEMSFQILRFSTYYGPKLGYMDTWLVSMITAAQQHREDIFCWLLQNPEDFNARSSEGTTIIHTMLKYNFTNLVPLDTILSKGADPDLPDEFDNTPIHVTLQLGMAQEFDTLLFHQASISSRDQDGNTPLHAAIKRGRLDASSRLLQHPQREILVNEQDSEGRSPLALAALMGLSKVARQLIDAGADPGMLDQAHKAPIHLAALGSTSGHCCVLALLLSIEQDVNILDGNGNTALHISIASQARLHNPTFDVCEQLLAGGADPQIRNKDGDLPIFLALYLLNKTLFSRFLPILLNYGADINARDPVSLSALHIAALHGEANLVRELIRHGASPNLAGNLEHGTPLHCCAEVHPATVGDECTRWNTRTWKAFSGVGKKEVIARHLIDAGADILAKFSSFDRCILEATPLDIALKVGLARVATVLTEEHHTRLSDSLGALHLEILQRTFECAVRYQLIQTIHQFLLSRIPVDKSSLCNFAYGMEVLAHSVYSNKYEILQCYKEKQTKMVVSDQERPHLSSLKHIENIPSLWAIISKSGSRVLQAEAYLRAYSNLALDSTGAPKKQMITIGRNMEPIVSDNYRPSIWRLELLVRNLSSHCFPRRVPEDSFRPKPLRRRALW